MRLHIEQHIELIEITKYIMLYNIEHRLKIVISFRSSII